MILMVDDDRFPLREGEVPVRALGAVPDPGLLSADRRGRERGGDPARRSSSEMLLATTSERQSRAIDHDGAASMERKKQEGYF